VKGGGLDGGPAASAALVWRECCGSCGGVMRPAGAGPSRRPRGACRPTGWVWNRTGSLLVLGLLHAAGNAVAPGSGFGGGFLRHLYPDASTAGMLHLLAFALVGIVVLIATRRRLGGRRTDAGERGAGP
jgi:hypothetical protein